MSTEATTVPIRRSYRCYHCNYSFHISNTSSSSSPSPSSSFRCPSCHHRHLLPHHTISPSPPPTATSSSTTTTTTTNSYVFPFHSDSDISSDNDIYSDEDSDSFLELTGHHHHPILTPTSKSFVNSLPTIIIDVAASESCPICMDDFSVNSDVNQLPCQHVFHKDCIVQWLNGANTCPLCRYQLPQEPAPSSSPVEEVFVDSSVDNYYYYELRQGAISRATLRRSYGMGSVSGSGLGGLVPREFWAEEQSNDMPRDADGDTLMVDA